MFSIRTRSPRRVDELSFLARRISTHRTLWIEEISFDFLFFFLFSPSLSLRSKFRKMGDPPPNEIFFSFYTLDKWIMSHLVSPLARVRFYLETIYFIPVQVKIILYELSLNYCQTSMIFFKILVFGVYRTPVTPKNMKIPIVSEFNEKFLGN